MIHIFQSGNQESLLVRPVRPHRAGHGYLIVLSILLLLAGTSPVMAAAPFVNFSAVPVSGTAPLAVSFTDKSINSPTGWAWYFGDETYSGAWTRATPAAGWTGRQWHSVVAMPDGAIVLTGGWNTSNMDDTWRSGDFGATWTLMNASPGWSARHAHSTVALRDNTILLMGGVSNSVNLNDVWKSTSNGLTWSRVRAHAEWEGRSNFGCVLLPDGSIVVMGGFNGDGRKNDTWRSVNKGATWTLMNASSGWSARSHSAVIAKHDGSIFLMGGYDGSSTWNDTWTSTDNGATWSLVSASSGWSARAGHTAVTMPDNSILLMGGSSNGIAENDVWRGRDNGSLWSRIPDAGWTDRSFHSSIVMPNGSVVLMGGFDGTTYYRDVWRFQPAGSLVRNPSHTYTLPGRYKVSLQAYNNDGFNSLRKKEYIVVTSSPAPTVTAITPAAGVRSRTITITNLSGTNFATGAKVFLNKTGYPLIQATNVKVVNAKKITCNFTIPANAPLGLRNVDVKSTSGRIGTKANLFNVKAAAAPTVTGITPKTARRGAYVVVTNLSGTGFVGTPKPKVQLVKGASLVTATNVTVVSAKKITCTFRVPAGATAGAWNVRVTNGDNQAGGKAGAFTVTA